MRRALLLGCFLLTSCVAETDSDHELAEPADVPCEEQSTLCQWDCAYSGRCWPSTRQDGVCVCIVVNNEDCRQSMDCDLYGMCTRVANDCVVGGPEDCEQTSPCGYECSLDLQMGGCAFDGEKCVDGCP